ncbi:MAG: hypothetical protein HY302_14515 [Opitutae bacterium]|nr:hypothetical protein [Opitutae bacterium]
MPKLTAAEIFELSAIAVAVGLVAGFGPRTGLRAELGALVAGAALLLLLQGFCRDLWLLRAARRRPAVAPAREARCMCVESTVGLTGVLAGVGLAGAGFAPMVRLSADHLALVAAIVLLSGFLLKDYVFEWTPWKIYREQNHAQVIFRWRK